MSIVGGEVVSRGMAWEVLSMGVRGEQEDYQWWENQSETDKEEGIW